MIDMTSEKEKKVPKTGAGSDQAQSTTAKRMSQQASKELEHRVRADHRLLRKCPRTEESPELPSHLLHQ